MTEAQVIKYAKVQTKIWKKLLILNDIVVDILIDTLEDGDIAQITSARERDNDKINYVLTLDKKILDSPYDKDEISKAILHELLHIVEFEYHYVVKECLNKLNEISGWASASLTNLSVLQRERMIIHLEHIIWQLYKNGTKKGK